MDLGRQPPLDAFVPAEGDPDECFFHLAFSGLAGTLARVPLIWGVCQNESGPDEHTSAHV